MEYCISIHALLAESDRAVYNKSMLLHLFLSTLSLRRATRQVLRLIIGYTFLSTLSLRRATQEFTSEEVETDISIHALLAESDTLIQKLAHLCLISIHALLAESDCGHVAGVSTHCHFYPRSPCGERLSSRIMSVSSGLFLSTLSLRRATPMKRRGNVLKQYFYPRSPCGERPSNRTEQQARHEFLSTLSLRRATVTSSTVIVILRISIHALLAESDYWSYL